VLSFCHIKIEGSVNMASNPDVRWKQRYQNFDRAFALLREALQSGPGALSALEREGTVQRFEYCFELAWKTLNDYLTESGVAISPVTPRQVIKDAFAAKLIDDGQLWMDMLVERNLLAHTYDRAVFDKAVQAIHARYLPALQSVHDWLLARMAE
jgi:nucleotidyltransferase substrate binding protein (TIGR01987 family)